MTRYFFDIKDGGRFMPDEDGSECATEADAMQEVAIVMTELAADLGIRSTNGHLSVSVRTEDGQTAFTGSLSFSVKRAD